MPFRRPTSPLSLEIVPPAKSDLDELLGSDDELDESTRAAKRRRIEKLGESYLQGKPLFILSASLRGPFDDGWVNPWRKTRRQTATSKQSKKSLRRKTDLLEPTVIPETDPKKRKLQDDSQAKLDRPRILSATAYSSSPMPERKTNSSNRTGKVVYHRPDRQSSEARVPSASMQNHPRRSILGSSERPATLEPRSSLGKAPDETWLKTDRRRMETYDINPPKSPTIAITRQRDSMKGSSRINISRASVPSTSHPSPATDPFSGTPARRKPGFAATNVSKRENVRSSSTSAVGQRLDQSSTKISPERKKEHFLDPSDISRYSDNRKEKRSPEVEYANVESDASGNDPFETRRKRLSLHYVPRSSHLPEFEYCRPKNNIRVKRMSSQPVSPAGSHKQQGYNEEDNEEETAAQLLDMKSPEAMKGSPIASNRPNDVSEYPDQRLEHSIEDAHNEPEPASLSLARISRLTTSTSRNIDLTITDGIQSAQVVPGTSGLREHAMSLKSTDMPESHTEEGEDDNPDPQLSTQAALLLAQKSFQDDLATPEREIEPNLGYNPASSQPSGVRKSGNSSKITPFYHLSTPIKGPTGDGPVTAQKEGFHAISTQCMIDAVTPFTFSSSRKSDVPIGSTGENVPKRGQRASFALSPSNSTGDVSPSLINRDRREVGPLPSEASKADAHHDTDIEQAPSGHPRDGRLESQFTALPFTLSGSTPTTAQQDGQGAVAGGMGTFNLSQAIDDAGSWLQQSWDINRDLKQCSGKSGPSSSAQAHRSPVGIDTIS